MDGFCAVRDTKWHYFQNLRPGDLGKGPALYDLAADPGETRNVAGRHPGAVAELRGLLADRFQVKLPPVEGAST